MGKQSRSRQKHKQQGGRAEECTLLPAVLLPVLPEKQGSRCEQRETGGVHATFLAFGQPKGGEGAEQRRQQRSPHTAGPSRQRCQQSNTHHPSQHAPEPGDKGQRCRQLPHSPPRDKAPAVQQPVIEGGLDIQFGGSRYLGEWAQRNLDVAGLVPPDILAIQQMQAQAPGHQQQCTPEETLHRGNRGAAPRQVR